MNTFDSTPILPAAQQILDSIGGTLDAQTMPLLNSDQITLLAYSMLHEEVMDGGFVQLIHNGLGPFIFLNPFAKAIRLWGEGTDDDRLMHNLSRLIYKGRELYEKYSEPLTRDCTDDEFMALFEQYPEFDDLDDEFIENEEEYTAAINRYVSAHPEKFEREG